MSGRAEKEVERSLREIHRCTSHVAGELTPRQRQPWGDLAAALLPPTHLACSWPAEVDLVVSNLPLTEPQPSSGGHAKVHCQNSSVPEVARVVAPYPILSFERELSTVSIKHQVTWEHIVRGIGGQPDCWVNITAPDGPGQSLHVAS